MGRNVTDVEPAGCLGTLALRVEVIVNGNVSGGAGSGGIDADSGDEVIHGAGGGVDGNAGHRGDVYKRQT